MNILTLTESRTHSAATRVQPVPDLPDNGISTPQPLSEAIQAAVDGIGESELCPLATDACPSLEQSRAVLILLVTCYVHEIYGSTDVASLMEGAPDFSCRWWETLPDGHALRRFRSDNVRAIQHCLEAALRFRGEQKIRAGFVTKVIGAQPAEEARRRITMAAFADSMELDGV
jgi:hypothetical protein